MDNGIDGRRFFFPTNAILFAGNGDDKGAGGILVPLARSRIFSQKEMAVVVPAVAACPYHVYRYGRMVGQVRVVCLERKKNPQAFMTFGLLNPIYAT